MNKKTLIMIFFALITAQVNAQTDSAFKTPYYSQRIAYFTKIAKPRRHIVFLGNSIIEKGEWQELVRGKNVLNMGISGDVTAGVLARIDQCAQAKPDQLFLLIGINDLNIGKPVAAIVANYVLIVDRIRKISPKTKIVVQGLLPVNQAMLSPAYQRLNNRDVSLVNAALEAECKNLAVEYIDLNPIFLGANGQLNSDMSTDGLHLRSAAYIEWTKYLKKLKLL